MSHKKKICKDKERTLSTLLEMKNSEEDEKSTEILYILLKFMQRREARKLTKRYHSSIIDSIYIYIHIYTSICT